jgi:hypothetical protein
VINDVVVVSDAYNSIDKPGIYMNVYFDTFKAHSIDYVVHGITEGLRDYIKENKAEEILTQMLPHIQKQIEKVVNEQIERRVVEVISKMDIQGLANLATVGAAKNLGKKIVD